MNHFFHCANCKTSNKESYWKISDGVENVTKCYYIIKYKNQSCSTMQIQSMINQFNKEKRVGPIGFGGVSTLYA